MARPIMDANTLSLLQQQQQFQHLQQYSQSSFYQYSNFNSIHRHQENQTLQQLTDLINMKSTHGHLTTHSSAEIPHSDRSNPYITKLLDKFSQLNPQNPWLTSTEPHKHLNYTGNLGFTNQSLGTDLINRLSRVSEQISNSIPTLPVESWDNLANPAYLALMNKFAHYLVHLNAKSCAGFTSPSISPESNRSGQLGDGPLVNPINLECASTPKPLDIRDRLQALGRLNELFNQNKQQMNDDLSQGQLFDNSQYTPLQSSMEESGCVDLSYTGAQKIRSTSNEILSQFPNCQSSQFCQQKQHQQANLSLNRSKSPNEPVHSSETDDSLTNLYENVKKPSSPKLFHSSLSTFPLKFDSSELFSSLLRAQTTCKSPDPNELTSPLKEEDFHEKPPTSTTPQTNQVHQGRTKNRKSGFQAGVTVGYTYDAFFISDGRSRKRTSNKNSKLPNRTRHSSNVLSPNSQSGISHSSNSSIDGSSLSVNTYSPEIPTLGSHLSLASTLSPPQESHAQRYSCPDCGKNYATSSNLSRHKQTHRSLDSQSARKCPQCGKAYVSMPALSMHMLTHDLKHRCDICGKAFSRPWLLQGHRRAHTGEKPYGCAHCGRAFADRSNLRAHMQTHSGMKHFECKQCHKNFALKSYLNKHLESGCLNRINTDIGKEHEHCPIPGQVSSQISNTPNYKSNSIPSLSWSITNLIS